MPNIDIELIYFLVDHTQGAADTAEAALKEGKSEMICEQGQLLKASNETTLVPIHVS